MKRNKNFKGAVLIVLAVMMLIITCITVFAVTSFKMTYKPGTDDKVTNLPEQEEWPNGFFNEVFPTVPEREGYEFIDWELDYETVPEPETEPSEPVPETEPTLPEPSKGHYSVVYFSLLEDKELGRKNDIEFSIGKNIEEEAEVFKWYQVLEPSYIKRPVEDGETIYFYYLKSDIG